MKTNLKDGRNFVDVKNGHDVGGDVDDDLVGAVDGRRRDVTLKEADGRGNATQTQKLVLSKLKN